MADSSQKDDIRPELENVMSVMKRKQAEVPADGGEPVSAASEGVGTVKKQKHLPPQATPNMNAEMAQSAAVVFKKKEKQIQRAVAELEGGNAAPKKSCCVIL